MRVEAVCTGDELLTGLTTDTNTTFFAGRLFALGEQLARVQVVGDYRDEIVAALERASSQADVLLVSGGLGPTADDLTAECAAKTAGVPLVEDARVLEHIRARFAERKLSLTPNNLRQALVPQGADVIINPSGSAPMFVLTLGRCTAFFVAGVPREYRYLVDQEVLPRILRIREEAGARIYRAARLFRCVGLAESHLDAKVAPLVADHPNVAWGFRTQAPENHLKLIASGKSQAEADQALAAVETAVRQALGESVFGVEQEQFAQVVGRLLVEAKATLAVAESCTGGLLSEHLTRHSGASEYFMGGLVTYANRLKEAWASVPAEKITAHGAVSAEVAESLAQGVRRSAGTTFGLGVTGIAGPDGGTPDKPVGTVYCALADAKGVTSRKFSFPGDREMIRAFSAYGALDMLRRQLLQGRA